jgi:SAM-dependent methyltransferase
MNLNDIVMRTYPPQPWSEGEKIPWNEPGFSQRMLAEHLTQAHDMASRRFETIERHVAWIHHLLSGKPSNILDLGCGPGLYAGRLTRLGHHLTGIDFSPASIAYARREAEAQNLTCNYIEGDLRQVEFPDGNQLVMFIFGEFNVFTSTDARLILQKAHLALLPGGLLLLEPHTYELVEQIGHNQPSWSSHTSGLFSDQPHLMLNESFWDADQHISTERYYIIDTASGNVTRYAASMQAYTQDQYASLLTDSGFTNITFHPGLTGEAASPQPGLLAITAQKR